MEWICERCGVQLSLPSGSCQHCGHPIPATDSPRVAGAGAGLLSPATNVFAPQGGLGFPLPDESLHSWPQNEFIQAEDAAKVEQLLGQIAGQSHFEERYVLQGELARGGMGVVHRGFDQVLRREVAIKTMIAPQRGLSESAALRGQFLKEARVGGRLLHPNVLPVFDLGVNRAGHIYYTMRLVDGASLQHCWESVERGVTTKLISYPIRRIVEAFVHACQGVDFAHQQGVIHLDLKPHNILMSGFNEVFVVDWGLARVDATDDTEELIDLYRSSTSNDNTASSTGVFGERVVGTPGYMSPEQARGAVSEFDAATDVYGLGGVLHFILYGVAPNQGEGVQLRLRASSERKTRGKLRSGVFPRGQRVRKEALAAMEALEAICLKALEPEQDERYPSVDAMIVELGEWLAATPGPPLGF